MERREFKKQSDPITQEQVIDALRDITHGEIAEWMDQHLRKWLLAARAAMLDSDAPAVLHYMLGALERDRYRMSAENLRRDALADVGRAKLAADKRKGRRGSWDDGVAKFPRDTRKK